MLQCSVNLPAASVSAAILANLCLRAVTAKSNAASGVGFVVGIVSVRIEIMITTKY